MEIEDNRCTICSKICINVFSTEYSLVYFNLLNELFGSIPNFTQNEDILQKHICIECSHNVNTVSKFLKTISTKNINSQISENQCQFCQEKSENLHTLWDLPEDFQEKMEFFVKTVIKNVIYESFWKICLTCSASVIYWSDFRKLVIKNEKINSESDKVNNICQKSSVIENANLDINMLVVTEKLRHLKTVSDLPFKNLWKLKYEIATNKQLMVEKPYIRLEKLDFNNYSCSWCRKAFATVYKATKHELRHCRYFSPKVRLERIPTDFIEYKLHGPKTKQKRNETKKEQWYYNILPVCESVYSDEENLDRNINSSAKNDTIVIDDSDNKKEHNPNLTKVNSANKNTEPSNYFGAYSSWLTNLCQKNQSFPIQNNSTYPISKPINSQAPQINQTQHVYSLPRTNQTPNQVPIVPNAQIQQHSIGQNVYFVRPPAPNGLVQAPNGLVQAPNGLVQVPNIEPNQNSLPQLSQGNMLLLKTSNGQLLLCQMTNGLVNQNINQTNQVPDSQVLDEEEGVHFLLRSERKVPTNYNNTDTQFVINKEPKLNSQTTLDNGKLLQSLLRQEPNVTNQPKPLSNPITNFNSPKQHFLVYRHPNGIVTRLKVPYQHVSQNVPQGASTSNINQNLNNLGNQMPISNSLGTQVVNQMTTNLSSNSNIVSQNHLSGSSLISQNMTMTNNPVLISQQTNTSSQNPSSLGGMVSQPNISNSLSQNSFVDLNVLEPPPLAYISNNSDSLMTDSFKLDTSVFVSQAPNNNNNNNDMIQKEIKTVPNPVNLKEMLSENLKSITQNDSNSNGETHNALRVRKDLF